MKKIIILALMLIFGKADPMVTQDMIYNAVIDTIKNIPENISDLGNHIYKKEIKKNKSYWWYFRKNTKLKIKLKENHIDYYTILKQGLYPKKPYDNSKEAEIKKYAILTALAKMNNIETNKISEKEKREKQKEKLKLKKEMMK